LPSQRIAHKN